MDKNYRIEQAYLKYKNQIYNFIFRLSNNHELALDVTQQTFVKALCEESKLDLSKSWFITVARNIFYVEVNHKINISIDTIDQSTELDFINVPFNQLQKCSTFERLQSKVEESITKMSLVTKEIMILYFIENLPIVKITKITGRSIIDVKVNLHHARVLFEARLIKNMNGIVTISKDICYTYSRITNQFFQSDIPESNLKMINWHISNCKFCIDTDEQLKQTGILLNLAPFFNAPAILDKIIQNGWNFEIQLKKLSTTQRNKCSPKINPGNILPVIISIIIGIILLVSSGDFIFLKTLFIT